MNLSARQITGTLSGYYSWDCVAEVVVMRHRRGGEMVINNFMQLLPREGGDDQPTNRAIDAELEEDAGWRMMT